MIEKIGEMDVSIDEMMPDEVHYAIEDARNGTLNAVRRAYTEGYNDAIDAITQKMGESTTKENEPSESLTEREKGRQDVWKVVCWISEMSYVDRKEIFGFETLDAIFGEYDGTALTWFYKENHNESE